MSLRICRSSEAEQLLGNESFRSQWTRLYQACPWATVLQSPAFVTSWYEFYKEPYRLILVCEFSAANELIGFLPLAIQDGSGRAVSPGAQQAEYKTWLALPSNGASFIEE